MSCGLVSKYKQYVKKLVRRAAVLALVQIQRVQDVWFTALD